MRKSGWLRFSVRTLLVAVTVFCVWLGSIAKDVSVVRERQAIREMIDANGGSMTFWAYDVIGQVPPPPERLSWTRGVLGDKNVHTIYTEELTGEEEARVQKAFPEAALNPTLLGLVLRDRVVITGPLPDEERERLLELRRSYQESKSDPIQCAR